MSHPVKGTIEYNISQEAWIEVEGYRCYIQRTVLFGGKTRPDAITFPEKYKHKLPCLVRILQTYKSGELMYPDLYVLREHMVLTKSIRPIQRKTCDGWVIPIRELENYEGTL